MTNNERDFLWYEIWFANQDLKYEHVCDKNFALVGGSSALHILILIEYKRAD